MSKKDYRQGMSDAMAAYEAFGEKQEAAIQHVGAEIEKTAGKVDKLGGKIGEIADYITDKEKAALYKLNTPVDIADLEDAGKRILLAVLYQLSADEDEVTEEQQNYVRAVQQYLKIYNPQTEIDLSAVENIEDISAQKAVLQSALEFFRLGTHPEELTEEQEDFLDCFQVNRKTRREITDFIQAIVDAVGVKGLSEKYGFVAAQPRSEFAKYKDNGPIPEKVADMCISLLKRHGLGLFINDHYFLETPKYLLLYVNSSDEIPNGFYRVEKETGDMKRIPCDMPEKNFYLDHLEFHIQNDAIYFINQRLHSEGTDDFFALDLKEGTHRKLPLQFPGGDNVRYHLSGNNRYLMVHTCFVKSDYHFSDQITSSQTFVLDLAQDNRTFLLRPKLKEIIDAFIWDGKFIFAGIAQSGDVSFFQYDTASDTLEHVIRSVEWKVQSPYMLDMHIGNLLSGDGFGFCGCIHQYRAFHEVRYIDGRFYFWIYEAPRRSGKMIESNLYCLRTDTEKHYNDHIFHSIKDAIGRTYVLDNAIVHFTKDELFSDGCFARYDLEKTPVRATYFENDKGREFILLGDYIYLLKGGTWQKANVSQGWDNLQWEIVSFPD